MVTFTSVGQSISVGLSIRWEKTAFTDTTLVIPFLDVTYQNHSDSAYYFPGVARFYNWSGITRIDWNTVPNQLDGNYKVYLSFPSINYWGVWEVLPDSINIHEEHEIDYAEELLAYMKAEFGQSAKQDSLQKELEDWRSFSQEMEITSDAVINKIYRRMVFLNPQEKHVESMSLLGFFLLKGAYQFLLYFDDYNGRVQKPIWDEETQSWSYKMLLLPEIAGDYYLYKGNFFSNKTLLEIDK